MSLPRVLTAVAGLGLALGMCMPHTGIEFGAGVRERLGDPITLAMLGVGLCLFAAAAFPRKYRP